MVSKKTAKKAKKKVSKKVVNKQPTKNSKKKQVNWVLVLLMSIFFGWVGVDRFLMGKVGTGILKLLITIFTLGLLGWIWWLVDIILIASKYEFEGIEWVE